MYKSRIMCKLGSVETTTTIRHFINEIIFIYYKYLDIICSCISSVVLLVKAATVNHIDTGDNSATAGEVLQHLHKAHWLAD